MNRQEHHDKAEEQAEVAARLLKQAVDGSEDKDAGQTALSGGQSVVDLARAFAAVAQVHATLATLGDSQPQEK
jgi:ABC-type hemin transport system ATPase subunit